MVGGDVQFVSKISHTVASYIDLVSSSPLLLSVCRSTRKRVFCPVSIVLGITACSVKGVVLRFGRSMTVFPAAVQPLIQTCLQSPSHFFFFLTGCCAAASSSLLCCVWISLTLWGQEVWGFITPKVRIKGWLRLCGVSTEAEQQNSKCTLHLPHFQRVTSSRSDGNLKRLYRSN